MPERERIFHLAIPCRNVEEAQHFYVHVLGCREARRYVDRITLDFWGMQLVCHVAPDRIEHEPTMYPCHFGFTIRDEAEFIALQDRLRDRGASFFRNTFIRFEGRPERHRAFFIRGGQEKDEFLAAISRSYVLLPRISAQDVGGFHQNLIAQQVTVLIVHLLEVVKVHKET